MKKIIIILITLSCLFGEINNIIFLQTKEKNNNYPIKFGISIEYHFKINLGIGISTTTGMLQEDLFYRIHYRDISLNVRKYITKFPYLLFGTSYNLRINNDLLKIYDNKIFVTDYVSVETGLTLRFDNFEFNVPVSYKLGLNQWAVSFEFVIKYKKIN
jgi:hypothetical protein